MIFYICCDDDMVFCVFLIYLIGYIGIFKFSYFGDWYIFIIIGYDGYIF